MIKELITIGKITSTHGIQGSLKVYPLTDQPRRFDLLTEVLVELADGSQQTLTIRQCRYLPKGMIIDFVGFDSINQVLHFKNAYIRIPIEQRLPLAENEYYIYELIGLTVKTDEGEELGLLKDIIESGANDIYVVDDGSKNGLLIPAIKDCIKAVDMESREMIVALLPGLR